MGLSQSAELIRLAAAAPTADGRLDDIFLAVATLFEHQNATLNPRERELAGDILRHLARDVEMSIRIALAERLADDPAAPHELIAMLADDRIEIARPVLARSPVLSDGDFLRVIRKGSTDHHIVIAERPHIGETVSAALARSECEAVIIALLRNATAKIGHEAFAHLSERARLVEALQAPLISHPALPPAIAGRMYVWVSGALKTALAQRYPGAIQSLDRNIDEATAGLRNGKTSASEASARKLVAKLSASGQLRASFLIRVLQQGQPELFDHGFAALLGIDVEVMRKALYSDNPVTLALACRAVGIDRSVFLTVFNLSRKQKQNTAILSDSEQVQIQAVFAETQKSEALHRLKSAAA